MSEAYEEDQRRFKKWKKHQDQLKRYHLANKDGLEAQLPRLSLHLFIQNKAIIKGTRGNFSYHTPFNLVIAIKEENGGKLNSHLWALRAFAKQLNPEFFFLFDVGTKPEKTAIIRCYNEMIANPQIGGCCGEIKVSELKQTSAVVCAQNFEYKVSTFMEKAMESVFGYITVLPGAFSGYRYEALNGTPLDKYFILETPEYRKNVAPFEANMYLAEDRIMGFEMLVKENCDYILHYVADATAATDVPQTLGVLIRQRRRWLNGSMFASLYAIKEWPRLYSESGHSLIRKILLTFQLFYQVLNTSINLLVVANLFLTFAIVMQLTFYEVYLYIIIIIIGCSIYWICIRYDVCIYYISSSIIIIVYFYH